MDKRQWAAYLENGESAGKVVRRFGAIAANPAVKDGAYPEYFPAHLIHINRRQT